MELLFAEPNPVLWAVLRDAERDAAEGVAHRCLTFYVAKAA